MYKLRFAVVLMLAAIAPGCSDVDARFAATGPTGVGGASSLMAEIAPSLISSRPTGRSSCPDFSPFLGSLSLNVRTGIDFGVRLFEVRLQFTDIDGITAPEVTLPAPVLTKQFGSTLIAARSSRSFPFSFGLGCFTRHTGTLVVIITTVDDRGREDVNRVPVRVQ
jgi:hypothetical protein